MVPLSLPDDDPEWRFVGQAYPKWDACVLVLKADTGTVGYGYAAAFAHLGSTAAEVAAVLERLVPLIVSRDCLDIEANIQIIDKAVAAHHPAKSGIDCALHDLAARVLKVPMYHLFGGKLRDRIPLCRILALKSPEQMAERAQARVDEGYRCLKLKLSGHVATDAARVRAVRHAVGDDIRLIVDPNMAYTVKDAIAFIARTAEFHLDMIEQPVDGHDLEGLATVTRSAAITVEADESATSPASTFALASRRVVDAVSLKITKMGGLRNVMAAAKICEAASIGCRMGATVGSRLLTAHALNLCAALPHLTYPSELAEFLHVMDDPFEGLVVQDGAILVPDEIGAGVHARRDIAWAA